MIKVIMPMRRREGMTIDEFREYYETKHILICCQDGTTISPLLLSLYLIKYGGIQKSEVKKIIQSKNQAVTMEFDLNLLDL